MPDEPGAAEESAAYGRFERAAAPVARRRVPRVVLVALIGVVAAAVVAGVCWGVVAWWRDGRLPPGHDAVAPGDLRVGDCIRLPDGSDPMALVETVPCDEPHDAQVYAIVSLRDRDRATALGIANRAEAGCKARKAAARRLAPADASITTTYLMPSLHGSVGRLGHVECLLEVVPGPTSVA